MDFYKEKYDVVVIGGALAGMSCALKLATEGKSVLILERHNLPGGLATSFVRNGVEMEATLHEMMSIGPEDKPLFIREYLEQMGVKINWLRVPEAYGLLSPQDNIDIEIHAGRRADGTWICADEIDAQYPGTKDEINRLLETCKSVYESVLFLNEHSASKLTLLLKHEPLTKTAGYSAKEVLDKAFHLPKDVISILSAYWIYVGVPISNLPFTIYSFLMADYLLGGSYVAKGFSHEMSVAMAEKCEELGVQFEYCQEVTKILVKDNHVYGVRTKRGDTIYCDAVACAPYPNVTYAKMIEPQSEVPVKAIKYANAMPMGVTCFSVVMQLDARPEDLNINRYSVFSSNVPFDTDVFWEQGKRLGGWSNLTTICLNYANPDGVPQGKTSLSITYLPVSDPFMDVKVDDYQTMKRRIAKEMIEQVSAYLGVDLMDHIEEIEIESPMTIAHFAKAYRGGIYGYQHSMNNSVVARLEDVEKEQWIKGLVGCASHQLVGDGMACNINNGKIAAKLIMESLKEGR
ncbi:MAG: NAD(P)/FAD-dependent oxidoreductase [Erysipelotrichaceae bacterium]|nr:NAD(P)/FAD-dependent oxidoreductase [Erysipelotrichaceae bacterium]